MEIRSATISNRTNTATPAGTGVLKGQRGVCCLSCGVNMPNADALATPAKATGLIVESYMRRPSLGTEASDAIYKCANDSVLVTQSPQYPSFVSSSAVFILKNKFKYTCAGDNVIFRFVNGVFKEAFTGDGVMLGNLRYSSPKVSEPISFDKGENTFLICSRKFAEAFSENQLEDALIRSTHTTQKGNKTFSEVKCDRWLNLLWDNIPNRNDADEYSAVAISLPEKRKSAKGLIIGIIIAVILAVAIFLLIGALTRRPPQGPPDGKAPQPPQQNQDVDYNKMERPTGPNGEVAPDPPTRPPLN